MRAITEEDCQVDQPLEEGLEKIQDMVQEPCTKISNLKSQVAPATPLKEIAAHEEVMKNVVDIIEDYEADCREKYTHAAQIWNQWKKYKELRVAFGVVKEVQDNLERL